jgi:hypothetical protein
MVEKLMTNPKLTPEHLERKAIVYIRQSTPTQVHSNKESQRRQYGLADYARELGFKDVEVIDDDLGRSGCGLVERPGYEHLVATICTGHVFNEALRRIVRCSPVRLLLGPDLAEHAGKAAEPLAASGERQNIRPFNGRTRRNWRASGPRIPDTAGFGAGGFGDAGMLVAILTVHLKNGFWLTGNS